MVVLATPTRLEEPQNERKQKSSQYETACIFAYYNKYLDTFKLIACGALHAAIVRRAPIGRQATNWRQQPRVAAAVVAVVVAASLLLAKRLSWPSVAAVGV